MAMTLRKKVKMHKDKPADEMNGWGPLITFIKVISILFIVFSTFHWLVMKRVQHLPVQTGITAYSQPSSQLPATYKLHTVKPGETLWSIVIHLYPNENPSQVIKKMKSINGLNGDMIQPGQPIKLP
jgi:hypothetical protein